MLIRLLTLLCALVTCWAGPVPIPSISRECRSPSSLRPQQTLLYTYQGENRIENRDAQHNIQVKANIEIGTISPCMLSLKLLDVELHGVSVANRYAFKEALEKYPVLFHMEEGIIGEIRHDPGELPWAMNVKRAIMSMVQIPRTAMDSNSIVSETDIFGTCETKYRPMNVGSSGGIIMKSKNLATCFGRFGSSLPIIYTPYESKTSSFQTIPMTNGTMDCQQTVDGNRWITKSECKEREFLRMAARGMAEETQITSTMVLIMQQTFQGVKPVPDTVNMISSLKFDHSVTRVEKTDIKDAMSAMRDLCRSTAEDIRPEASATFSRMVHAMRGLPYEHLKQIYTQILAGEICFDRKLEALYLDALPLIGTEASLKQTVELMSKAEHAERFTAWIAGLSSISYPTEGMINVLIPMVRKPNAPRNLILAVTSMAHMFCRGENRNCDDVPAIKELQGALTKILSYKCRATDAASRNRIVTALKGFGNLGYHGEAINSIMECAIAANNPLPIRLAAIESFRRSCIPEVQSKLLELMKSTGEDVEIRIASYLGVMRCPSPDDIMEIVKMVDNEQTKQVSSFIMSHLRNLQETKSPTKMGVRSLLSGLLIKNSFDSDFRKSSQNLEWSQYSEKFNMGATADANVIYHPKSFVPRRLMMNLTVDLFSHSINLFEIGGRAEGYDHMLESLLAPKRQIGNSHKNDSFWTRLGEKLSRPRRASAKTMKVDIFDEKVNIMKPNQPSGSIYFKMFGNELSWLELPTMDDMSDFANGIKTNNWMTQLMNQKQMDIARSAMLIDTTVTVPTVTGFPFRADIMATVTGGIKTDGKVNLDGAPKDMLIEGFIKPSAAVDLTRVMSIDAGVAKRGIRVTSTIHTSTALDGKVEIKPTGEVNLKYNIRQEKQEILNLKTTIFSVEAEVEAPMMAPATKDLNMCTQTLSNALGVSLCLKGRVPKPFVDYKGINLPFDLALTLQKNDLLMEGYEFKLKFPVAGSDPRNQFYQLIMDTPGSSINRKHLIELQLKNPDIPEASMHFLYSCPMKKIEISASARNHGDLANVIMEANIDDAKRYFIKFESPYQEGPNGFLMLQPTLEMGCPNTEPFVMKGKIENNRKTGLMIDLRSNMPANKPAFIKGSMVSYGQKKQLDMAVSLMPLDFDVNVMATNQERTDVTAMTINYQWAGQRKHDIKYSLKIQNLGTEHIFKAALNSDMQMSQYPEYNWQLTTDILRKPGEHREDDIKFWWGENLPEEQRHIHVLAISKQSGEFGPNMKGTNEGRLKILAPVWNIDLDGSYNNMLDMEGLPKAELSGEIRSDGTKAIEWEAKYNHESRSPMRVSLSARVEGPSIRLNYVDRVEQRGDNEYLGNMIIEWGRQDKRISTDYVVMMKIDPASTLYDVDYRISYPGMQVPAHHRNRVRFTRDAAEASTETEVNGNKYVTISTKWNRNKLAEISIDTPVFQTVMSRTTKDQGVTYMAEVRPRFVTDKAYVSSLQLKGSIQRSMVIHGEFQWDADRDVNQRVRISSTLIRTALEGHSAYQINGVFEHCTHLKINFNGNFAGCVLQGPHSMDLSIGGHHTPTRTMSMTYNRHETGTNVMLAYIKGAEDQLKVQYIRQEDHAARDTDLMITSVLFPEIDGKHLNIHNEFGPDTSCKITYTHAPGKVFRIEIFDASRDNRINANIKVQTPFPRYASQEFMITGDIVPYNMMLEMQATSSSNKIYNFKFSLHQGEGTTQLIMDMTTPHKSIRNGNLLVKYASNSGTMKVQFKSVYNDQTMFDLQGNVRIASRDNFDGRLSLTSAVTHDVEVVIRGRSTSPLNSMYELNLMEAGSNVLTVVLTRDEQEDNFKGKLQVSGATIATRFIEVERKIPERGHRTYSLRTGPETPLLLVLDTKLMNGLRMTSMRYEPPNNPEKWGSISFENNEDWSDLNKKLTIVMEPKPNVKMTIDYLYQKSDSLLKSKAVLSMHENKLGYEFKSRTEGDTSSSTLMKLLYFKREVDIHHDFILTADSMEATLKILLNAVMMPDRMFVLAYKSDRIPNGWQAVTTMSHPTFLNDIILKVQILRDISDKIPLKVEAELQPGDAANKVYFNMVQKIDDQILTNRSIHMHMHHEDRSMFDTSLTMYRTATMERPIFAGYYWSWTTQRQGHKTGHATLFLGKNGRAHFDYDSFLGKISASGESHKAANGDDIVDVVLHGSEEFKGRIIYNPKKYHFEGLTFDRDGKTARSFEISASNSSKKDMFKMEMSHYEGNNKLTDFSYAVEKRGAKAFRSKLFFPPHHVQTIKTTLREIDNKLSLIDISEVTQDISDMAQKADTYMTRNFVEPLANHLLDESGELMGEAVIEISEMLEETPLGEFISHMTQWLDDIRRMLDIQIKKFIRAIADPIMSMASSMGHSRRRRDISSSWDDLNRYLSDKMDELSNTPMFRQVSRWMNDAMEYTSDKISETMYRMSTKIGEGLDAIKENPDYKALESAIAELYQPGSYQTNSEFWDKLKANFAFEYSTRKAPAVIREVDYKNGKYIVDVNLPDEVDAMKQQMNAFFIQWKMPQEENEYEPSFADYISSMARRKWLPPFDGQAMIISQQHFVTFDGSMYSAAGDCTYLLARDFVDGNFTVLLKYHSDSPLPDGRIPKSIIVQLGESYIEVFPDQGSMFLNGQAVELPLILEDGDVVVKRVDDVVIIEDEKILKVACHLYYDVCTVKINGWYFGNTAGLLGTYNNEPSDDFIRPRGQVVNNVGQFMKKWEMMRGCKAPVNVLKNMAPEGSEGYQLCERYFKNEDSPLFEGFWQESPEPYFDLCLRHMAALPANQEPMRAVCNISLAYLLQLEKYSIMASLPTECLTCQIAANQKLGFGETARIDNVPSSMDIVLVVEEDACHADVVRELDSTIRLVDKELIAAGFSNNRFSLVGFGHGSGRNSMPHIRTARGSVFFESHNLPLATEKMRLEPVAAPAHETHKDIFDAIRYASVLPFRPGVSKTIIVMACADCDEERSELSYSDIQNQLLEHGITLHLVSDKPIEVRKSIIKGKGIYGLDADSVYGSKDVSQRLLLGQPDLRPQVAVAKDVCIALAQEVHGSFFSTKAMRSDAKNWKTVFAKRIVKSLQPRGGDRDSCERCDCTHAPDFTPIAICRPCVALSPRVPLALYTSED